MKNQNIIKLYLYNIFHGLIFAYVIERLFWASRGMSVQDVVWVEIIYAASIVLLEIPTGMLADRFSRKHFIVFDAILSLVEIVIITHATSFWHFALAILLSGIGHTFQSGAHNALLYDSLKEDGFQSNFESVLARIEALDHGASLLAALIGAVVATRFSYVSTYWMSTVSLLLALLVSLSLKEVKLSDRGSIQEPSMQTSFKQAFTMIIQRRILMRIMLVGVLIGSVIGYVDEFWQIYLNAIVIPVEWFGVSNLLSFLAFTLGAWALGKKYIQARKHKMLKYALVLSAFALILMGLIRSQLGLVFVVIVYFVSALTEPVILGEIHDQAESSFRATIESMYSMAERVGTMVVGLPFGFISTRFNIFYGFIYLGIITIMGYALFAFNDYQEKGGK